MNTNLARLIVKLKLLETKKDNCLLKTPNFGAGFWLIFYQTCLRPSRVGLKMIML